MLWTHVIIWHALQPGLLSPRAKSLIEAANDADGMIFCNISLWEIAMLLQKGRIHIDTSYLNFIHLLKMANNYVFIGISPEIAELSIRLPVEIDADPADRIIAATAVIEDATLVTADKNLRNAKAVRTVW